MDRFCQSSTTSSRLSPPHTTPPPRPSIGSDKEEELQNALHEYIEWSNRKIAQLKAQLKEKDDEINEFNSKRATQLKELHELRNEREAQRLQLESTATRLTELKVYLSKAESEALKAKDLKSEISREYSILKRQLEGTEHRLKEAEERAESAAIEMKNAEVNRDAAVEEARKTRDQLDDCRSKLQAQTGETVRLQKMNEKLADDLCKMKVQSSKAIKQLDDQVEAAMNLKRSIERQRDEALEKLAHAEQQHMMAENQIHKLKLDLKEFEKSDGRLRLQIDELAAKLKSLEEERGALRNDRQNAEKDRAEAVEKYERLEHSQESVLAENRRLRVEIDDLKRVENQKLAFIDELNTKMSMHDDEKQSLEAKNALQKKMIGELKTAIAQIDREYEKKTEENRINQRSKEMVAEELVKVRQELETSLKDYEGVQKAMDANERGLVADNRRLREKLESLTEEFETMRTDYQQELHLLSQEKTELEIKTFDQLQRFSAENKENEEKVVEDCGRLKQLEKKLQEVEWDNSKLKDAKFLAVRECEALKKRVDSAEEEKQQIAHNEAAVRLKLTQVQSEMERLRNSFTDSSASQVRFEDSAVTLPVVHEEEEEEEEEEDYHDDEGAYESDEVVSVISRNDRFTGSLEKKKIRDYVGVPLLRGDRMSSSTSQLEELHPPSTTISIGRTCKSKSSSTLGTMRHDIPHRFKSSISWKHGMCGVCFEAIPSFRYLYKCQDCGMCTHRRCCNDAIHTCGLPTGCADFYIENSMLASPSPSIEDSKSVVMNGWVKMALNGNGPWRDYWATMNRDTLAFYDNEALAVNDGNPRFAISMNDDNWRIHSGTSASLHNGSKALAIEIHMQNGQLYLLAPTVQSKQRWVQSLQRATNRRLYVRRRSSKYTVPVRNTPFLTMNHPEDLSVNATLIVEGYLLIAAQEGLYAVPEDNAQSSALVRIAGLCDVYHMELIEELDRLLIVHGSSRELLLVNLIFIGHLRLRKTARAECTEVGKISNCHLMASNKNSKRRMVYAATTDKIYVLKTDEHSGFSVIKEIRTEEPCTCLLPTARGFAFGADDFNIVTIDRKITKRAVRVDRCPPDYPVSALNISENEILLSYHNYGVFVDLDGRRTRRDNVEWSRAPLEFVFTDPFLYVVHYESLEILELAPYDRGIESKTFKTDRDMYKCRNAHFAGYGPRPNDVIFALAGSDRVELHMFNLGGPIDCLKV